METGVGAANNATLSTPNIVPLIDVLLVLIIIFMVITPLASNGALGLRLADIFKQRSEKIAFVTASDQVPFAQVARAISIMRAAGIDDVGLINARATYGGKSSE